MKPLVSLVPSSRNLVIFLLLPAVLWILLHSPSSTAQAPAATAAQWEYGILKWDGPDRIYYNLPDRFELVHLRDRGVDTPKNAQDEEFYLAWAANDISRQGWEVINLDSRRLLLRRPLIR